MPKATGVASGSGKHAFLVATGILLSRLSGLVRQRFLAHYLGLSDAGDAFAAALRVPNFLQNLFGEGVLSASFIPVYARLLAEDQQEEATRVAQGIGLLLGLTSALLVALGVIAPGWLLGLTAVGFVGEKRELTIHLVRVLFPGAGLLVMSAWCLGVLNSHKKFLLSYTAPVLWNLAIITSLLGFGGKLEAFPLAEATAIGSVVGSLLQLLVQLPAVIRILRTRRAKLGLELRSSNITTVIENFVPVFIGRGVVQISAYVDQMLASLLPGAGAVVALSHASVLYLLPVSLFGMSISAAELPEMSSAVGTESEVAEQLRTRLDAGLRRIAFFVVPSAVAFLALGDILAGSLLQSGAFTADDSTYVWGILAGSAVGLLASTLGRLYASTYYALRDTKTPLRFALLRVALTTVLGYLAAVILPGAIGIEARWGAAGLTASAGVAGWIEFLLLRATLNARIGRTGLPLRLIFELWAAALASGGLGFVIKLGLGQVHPLLLLALAVGPFGLSYFALTYVLGVTESKATIDRVRRKLRLG